MPVCTSYKTKVISKLPSTALLLGLLSVAVFTQMPATADQSANTDAIQEVFVYASLDQRILDDFTGSLSILNSDVIERRNAQHIDQILALSPNTQFSGGASRGRFVQIRGIGDIEQFVDPKPYPAVGLLVDNIELNGLFASGLLFDTQQVEILRGPQGTQFGSGALAGLINIVSTDPGSQNNNFIELGLGRFFSRQFGAAVGGELNNN